MYRYSYMYIHVITYCVSLQLHVYTCNNILYIVTATCIYTCNHILSLQLHEAIEDAEDQRRQLTAAKKKASRLASEMQDTKLHLEEQMSRNNDLERKQRRSVWRYHGDISFLHVMPMG